MQTEFVLKAKNAMKRVAAISASTMMGATVLMGAVAAADLSDYPAPFIANGQWQGLVVVGADAAPSDVVGAIDLSASLSQAAVTRFVPETATTTTTVTGDAWRVDKSTDFLEYLEYLNGVADTVTDDDLDALDGDELVNDKGTFSYSQFITVPDSAYVDFTIDPDDEDDMPMNYLIFDSGANAYVYKMEFPTALESELESTSTDSMTDLEDETLTILGEDYTLTNALRSAQYKLKLEMMGGAVRDTLFEGDTATYTLNGKDYVVEVTVITDTAVPEIKFKVNGEVTKSLKDGETEKLSDGIEIGVRDLLTNEAGEVSGGKEMVDFFLGAKKIVLEDTAINDSATGEQTLEMGGENIDDTVSRIDGDDDGDTVRVSNIQLYWMPDDDIYVPVGGMLSDYQDEEGQLFGNFDIEFVGMSESTTDEIKLDARGDDEYRLQFPNSAGNTLTIPYLDLDGTTLSFGEEDPARDTWFMEDTTDDVFNIERNDHFVVSNNKDTYALKYKGSDASSRTITFGSVGTGNEVKISYTGTPDQSNADAADASLTLGSRTFNVWVNGSANDAPLSVDMNGDGILNNAEVDMYTKNGALIQITTIAAPVEGFTVTTEELDDGAGAEVLNVTFDDTTSDEIDVAALNGYNTSANPSDHAPYSFSMNTIGDADNQEEYSVYGVRVYRQSVDSGPDQITFTYPDDQIEAEVYLTSGAVSKTVTSATEGVIIQSIAGVAVARLDTEVTDKTSKPLILIGGSAVNRLSAEALGLTYPTYGAASMVPENKGMVKLIENAFGGTNVAMVVAGWTADNTRDATAVLKDYATYQAAGTLAGDEVEVSSAAGVITVGPPTVS